MARPVTGIGMGAARWLILSTCAPLLPVSCKVGPDYEAPVMPTPNRWAASAGPEDAARADLDTSAAVDLSQWWAELGDPQQ